jgi:hypothetical protein
MFFNIPQDSPKGYILKVDLSYPKELHDYHSELPLAPENKNLPKLLTTLYDKEKYVIYYTTLKLFKDGFKIKESTQNVKI